MPGGNLWVGAMTVLTALILAYSPWTAINQYRLILFKKLLRLLRILTALMKLAILAALAEPGAPAATAATAPDLILEIFGIKFGKSCRDKNNSDPNPQITSESTNSMRIAYKWLHSSGQVMLITVLALSGTILGATTIAGLLMLYQIRQSADIINSAKAVFAADSGLERALYEKFRIGAGCLDVDSLEGQLSNGSKYVVACNKKDDDILIIESKGVSGKVSRAFEINL